MSNKPSGTSWYGGGTSKSESTQAAEMYSEILLAGRRSLVRMDFRSSYKNLRATLVPVLRRSITIDLIMDVATEIFMHILGIII
jgi:hypothetical protein